MNLKLLHKPKAERTLEVIKSSGTCHMKGTRYSVQESLGVCSVLGLFPGHLLLATARERMLG